jgi:tyrosyl-tRNA synthetase
MENREEKINELITRGVEDIFVKESLLKKLQSGKKLRVKLGIDPTGATLHIGRAVTLWKLRAFQDLGHQIVMLVGDFTAQIGDPSDKLEKRPMLSAEEVKNNLKQYKKIIGKIIDVNKAEFVFNSKCCRNFLSKMSANSPNLFRFSKCPTVAILKNDSIKGRRFRSANFCTR